MTSDLDPGTYPMTIYYDASCLLCNTEINNLKQRSTDGRLAFVDISAPGFSSPLPGVTLAQMMALIHARKADGSVIRGVEVFRLAYGAVGIGWVAGALGVPVIGALAERVYPWIARHRQRFPRFLVRWLFDRPVRRAAEKSAAQAHCRPADGCRLPAKDAS